MSVPSTSVDFVIGLAEEVGWLKAKYPNKTHLLQAAEESISRWKNDNTLLPSQPAAACFDFNGDRITIVSESFFKP